MLLTLLACTSSDSTEPITNVVSLRVDPAEVSLTARADAPATTQFTAMATFDDGTEGPLDLVSWESSSTSAGTVDTHGLFTSSDENGGITTITASHAGIESSASVTVVYAADYLEDGVDAGVPDAFTAAEPADDATITFAYPPDNVTVPRNLNGFGFEWLPPRGAISRLHFRSELTDVSVYTTGESWIATSDLWTLISAANTHGSVSVQVETGVWDGATLSDVRRGPAIDVTVNRFDAQGSVLYWDSSMRAILRIPFGQTTSTRFWPTTDDGSCVGCHSLAEGQDRMVVTHDGINGVFTIVDVSDPDNPQRLVGPADDRRLTFKAISPDGLWMMGVANGILSLYDLTNGARIATLDTGGYPVTQPDWSPDGQHIVLVRMTGTANSDMSFSGGEIVQASWDGTTLGTPEVLVPRASDHNNYYPTYSPDGKWIAYNRSTGDSYADSDAEIWLRSTTSDVDVKLTTANGASNTQNSYPRWGPLPDDDVLWLAFSSRRGYALEPSDSPQIWVSAIDPSLAETGQDPSKAPFWLPGQSSTANNHLPVWWDK
jgi:hypothetical protein